MVSGPIGQPLRTLTDDELRKMATRAAMNVVYSLDNILGELTYREQRRLAKWVAWLIAGTLGVNLLGVVLIAVL